MTDYQPKHLKQFDEGWGHCCFAGCTPMGCPGRCCVFGFGHRADCPENIVRRLDEVHHDIYVDAGKRKHLAPPRIVGGISRFCPECGCKAVIIKRVCFGADPHNMYRCTNCRWSGRNPGVSHNG